MSTVPYTMEPVHFSPQTIYCGDCRDILKAFPANSVDLVYIDPPFNSGRTYETFWGDVQEKRAFKDRFGPVRKYIGEMRPAIEEIYRILKPTGSFYYHCDWHASHYIKVMLDEIFGISSFLNEVIWYYRGGGVSPTKFGRRHDTIFLYSKGKKWTFNPDEIRIPYSEESLERLKYKARAFRGERVYDNYEANPLGKHPDDVWIMQPIMPSAKERLGYPTQKPLALLDRIVKASSNPGDIVLDAFCGCGTALVAAHKLGRRWIGIDISPSACAVMGARVETDCGMRVAPPLMSAEDVANSWKAKRPYYRFSNLPRNAAQLRALPPFEFENWAVLQLGEVLRHKGHAVFAKTNLKKVGDLGLDGKIYLVTNTSLPKREGETLFGERQPYLPVQVKHTQDEHSKVGRPVIDSFSHALLRDKRQAGFVIGWDFTKDALEEIERVRQKLEQYIFPVTVEKLIAETFDVELLTILGKLGTASE